MLQYCYRSICCSVFSHLTRSEKIPFASFWLSTL
nr:MAG TPA: hypothetical protein [Caudoviricetes sp.]